MIFLIRFLVLQIVYCSGIFECVRKYMSGISPNLQSLSTYTLNTYDTNFGVPPRCFCSYRLWLNKSNHRVKHVNISESNDINQSISMNRFCSIKALIFIREVFVFL